MAITLTSGHGAHGRGLVPTLPAHPAGEAGEPAARRTYDDNGSAVDLLLGFSATAETTVVMPQCRGNQRRAAHHPAKAIAPAP